MLDTNFGLTRILPVDVSHRLFHESWFERNRFVYLSEPEAVRRQLPKSGKGVEIHVGTGRLD